ncbi:MAG TPA: PilZ domain-containing protein [Polyangiales bacterium]|jgi:c-di-GMP-binding flagellar brake protein YcgR|nr:PilZ domain-containing protein [Polyangiales bacterium]
MEDNRRKHKRFEAAVNAEIEVDELVLEGQTRDISNGGVSVLVDEPLDEGVTVAVTLILTEDGIESAHEESFTAPASVMWTAPTDAGACLAGLRFGNLDGRQTGRLQRFLAALAENKR